MKRSTLYTVFLTVLTWMAAGTSAYSCNLTDATFCGFTPNGPNDTTICITVRYGYGRTGSSKGADNDTRSVAFGWYTDKPGFSILSFSPSHMISGRGFSNCTMPGSNIGPQGAPYNTRGTIFYTDPGYYGQVPCNTQPFACISTTARCGNVAQQTINYTFRMTRLPDSVRVFGAEGAGNPTAGCYPSADMRINFTTLPIVWGEIEAIPTATSVKVKWSTLEETNADVFIVERATQGSQFVAIGEVRAMGYTNSLSRYDFLDHSPSSGANRYRLLQLDRDGQYAYSEVVEAEFAGPSGLVWGAVGPNPFSDLLNVTYYNDGDLPITLWLQDQSGATVMQQKLQPVIGPNALQLDLKGVESGIYFLRMQRVDQELVRKVVKF